MSFVCSADVWGRGEELTWVRWFVGSGRLRLRRARTFMRSVVKEDETVGLLLFDEPSASLDPVAEHGKPRSRVSINTIVKLSIANIQTCSIDYGSSGEARRCFSHPIVSVT